MTLWRYAFGVWCVAEVWTFAVALLLASSGSWHDFVYWMALWFYSVPATLLAASGSVLTFPMYRAADSTAGRGYVYAVTVGFVGVLGVLLTYGLMHMT